MPFDLHEENDGKILVIRVVGKITAADYGPFVPEFERLLALRGKLRILFDMSGFHGWNAGAAWADIKFDYQHHADIDRLAMVGDKKWQQALTFLFKPFTSATLRYFDLADLAAARQWLMETPPPPSP